MATFLGFNISVELPPFCGESAQKSTSREEVGKGLGKCIFRNGLSRITDHGSRELAPGTSQ